MPDDFCNHLDATGSGRGYPCKACTCQYCGATHDGEAAAAARERIAAEESARFGAAEARARSALDEEMARVRAEKSAEIQSLRASQDAALKRAREEAETAEARSQARLAEALADARKDAERASAEVARVATDAAERKAADAIAAEQARSATLETQLAEAATTLQTAVSEAQLRAAAAEQAARAEISRAREEADLRLAESQAQLSRVQSAFETRVREVETRADAARAKAVLDAQISASEDKLRLQEQLRALQRQLEEKSNKALGDEGEADILEMLRNAFPEDEILHVGAGNSGADVVQTIRFRGEVAGRIIYDAKNRKAWRSDYVAKLREDMARHQADHAVLACLCFPAGTRQLHVEDGVVLASPARVAALAEILRGQVISMFRLRLSGENRAEKASRLYEFIASEQCNELLDRMSDATGEIEKLADQERRWHERHWVQRQNVVNRGKRAHSDLTARLAQHIGLSNGPETPGRE